MSSLGPFIWLWLVLHVLCIFSLLLFGCQTSAIDLFPGKTRPSN